MGQRLPSHKPPTLPDSMPAEDRPSAHARGYGEHWRKLRLWQLSREPLCRKCIARGFVVAATEVDHVKPRSAGGSDEPDNLQSLCKKCHSIKTATHDGGFGRKAVAHG